MTGPLLAAITVLISYLIGSIPFGYLIARWRGVDIFKVGSGNVGATNVARALGWRLGILVFVLDFAKGALPTATATLLTGHWQLTTGNWLSILAGLSAVIGHLFPVFLRFHGGKGVATGAGVVVVLLPVPALAAVVTWVVVVGLTRFISLASLAAAASLCLFRFLLTPYPFSSDNCPLSCFALLAVGLVVARHHANIQRLLHGNENRLPESQHMTQVSKIIHVLAVGLWFGSAVFFLIAALVIFNHFENLGASADRPAWIPLPPDFNKEMGTRLAGVAVGPLFDWYFPLQIVCGILAVITGLTFSHAEPDCRVHRRRNVILLLATITVVVGWLVADHVAVLRLDRYSTDEAVAQSAKAVFAYWHGLSLLLNMIALALVTVAMALATQLPNSNRN